MAKFCTKCGKALEDGKVCDCFKEVEKTSSNNIQSSNIDFNKGLNDYIDIIRSCYYVPNFEKVV